MDNGEEGVWSENDVTIYESSLSRASWRRGSTFILIKLLHPQPHLCKFILLKIAIFTVRYDISAFSGREDLGRYGSGRLVMQIQFRRHSLLSFENRHFFQSSAVSTSPSWLLNHRKNFKIGMPTSSSYHRDQVQRVKFKSRNLMFPCF